MAKKKSGSLTPAQQIIAAQKRRRVPAALRGQHTPARKALADAIRGTKTRGKFKGGVRQRDRLSADGKKYVFKKKAGGVDRKVDNPFRFVGGYQRARSLFKSGVLGTRIVDKARATLKKKGKLRILDIGSAGGQYWHYFLKQFTAEERSLIEIHTLNPDNHYLKLLKTVTPAENQHVGVIETVAPQKLGKFDIATGFYSIGEKTGTTVYDSFRKIKNLLAPGGTSYSFIGHKGMRVEPDKAGLNKMLGSRFNLDMFKWDKRTFNHPVVFTRTK
ncbi:MAG: hypothetical protein QGI60_03440 [archaeon]|jgi:hypothetical protein|nr:hypothetical protein [archaeon]